jgi:hypothetical protein
MPDPSADIVASVALIRELSGITSVLNRADVMIKGYEIGERDAPSIIALLAAGVERLAKVTTLLATGRPPPRSHRIVDLDEAARAHMRAAPQSAYVRGLIAHVDVDPLVARLLHMLDVYADQGRYHHLDQVAGRPVADYAPITLWEGLGAAITQANASVLSGRNLLVADDVAAMQDDINLTLRRSLFAWREMYYRAWCNGLCGARVKQFSSEIAPDRGMARDDLAALRAK